MTPQSPTAPDRTTRILVALSGVTLVGYLALRPWQAGDTAAGWAHPLWPVSHLLAVIGFLAYAALAAHRTGRLGRVLAWLSAGLLIPYYGAEAFGLHAAARIVPDRAADLAQAFRYGTLPMVTFALGWIALGWAAVLTARTLLMPHRAGRIAVGVHTAAMLAWLPVFFLPPTGRVVHVVVLGVAAAVVALGQPATRSSSPALISSGAHG